jgi:hypothetical protein
LLVDIDLRGEFLIGGVWVDATGSILKRQSLTHTRGRQDQGARVDPSTCRPLINNTDGKFSPDNPLSPYYGQFGRNTPFRISARAGSPALDLPGSSLAVASTPDTAALDIVGDIDIRVDATLSNWTTYAAGTLDTTHVIGKLGGTGAKSWFLGTRGGSVYFEWAADGSNVASASSTVPFPVPANGRVTLRVTLDVDNGASGRTVTFYTGPAGASGPWTQLGDPVVQAGVTSIFNSATALRIGRATDIGFTQPIGRVHKAEVRNGIGGSVVAAPDFSAQAVGAASFTDSAGRTWTVTSPAAISDRRTRLSHELAAYPTRWHPSGAHAWVDAQTAGILRRLGRGNKALDSTLHRRIPSGTPLAYWPMEEAQGATQFYSPIAGVLPLKTTGLDLASDDSLAGSGALPAIRTGGTLNGPVPPPAGSPTSWHCEFVFRATAPAANRTVLGFTGTGTVKLWLLQLTATGAQTLGYDDDGTLVTSLPVTLSNLGVFGAWCRWQLFATQSGSTINYTARWIPIGGVGANISNSFTGSIGRISGVRSDGAFASELDGMNLGHVAVFTTADTLIYNSADLGFAGETAGQRMQRLASEEGLPLTVSGVVAGQLPVGAQRPNAILDLLEDAADADGGILYEDRERPALRYRDRAGMYNQAPALVLDYNGTALGPPLEPTGDDDATLNDVTVTRTGGSSGRAVLEEGPLSVQAPPNGVGRYDTSVGLNLYSDEWTDDVAGWLLHLGTYEGRRYPQVRVMVHRAPPALLDQILAVDVGDKIVIQNPPKWVAPGDIELIVQGYEESWPSRFEWDIVFNCTPAPPWTVAVRNDTTLARRDTAGSQLAAGASSSATSLPVLTTKGPLWTTDPADMPLTAKAGGEVVTVNAIASSVKDAFGRTVSNSWGAADSGQAWTTSGGAAADYGVLTGFGSHINTATSSGHHAVVAAVHPDFDVYCDITAAALSTGSSQYAGILARYTNPDNLYEARVDFLPTAAIALTVRKRVATVETQLGAASTSLTHVAGTFVRVRFQGSGTTLRAKIWQPTAAEPSDWGIEVTDSDITVAGSLGVKSVRNAGNTNTNAEIRFDNLELINPQTFTVTRSQNGIVKAQTSGTAVSLTQPGTRAL